MEAQTELQQVFAEPADVKEQIIDLGNETQTLTEVRQ